MSSRSQKLASDGGPSSGRSPRTRGAQPPAALRLARPPRRPAARLSRSLASDGGASSDRSPRTRGAQPPAALRLAQRPRRPAARFSRSLASDGGAPAPRRPAARKARLLAPLERIYRETDWVARADLDAIRYPSRYPDPADREIVGLLSACMAYGRVDLFGPWIEWALARMGDSPAQFVRSFDAARHGPAFDGFHYRFNRAGDLVAFCLATQRILSVHGSLGAYFAAGFHSSARDVGPALERFVDGFLTPDLSAAFARNRLSYGYRHWFPRPATGGACKRLHLYLRWMIRREPPDFGLWTAVPPRALLMPVDTHIENMARSIGLTRR